MAHNEEVRLHFLDYWRVIRVRWVLIVLAFLLVVITTAIVTYFQPRLYQSSVFIEAVANEALMLNSGSEAKHLNSSTLHFPPGLSEATHLNSPLPHFAVMLSEAKHLNSPTHHPYHVERNPNIPIPSCPSPPVMLSEAKHLNFFPQSAQLKWSSILLHLE